MMRINLLPPEILERRKAEKRIGWVALGALVVAIVLAGVGVFGYFRLESKRDEFADVQQQVQSTNADAERLAIFEQRASELEVRRQTAVIALDGRRNWSRLFNEVSLVMPVDLWVQTMAADEASLQMSGWAVDSPTDTPDLGHTSIAKLLVRLADLEQLSNVWLTNSGKSDFEDQSALQFSVIADVSEPVAESETP